MHCISFNEGTKYKTKQYKKEVGKIDVMMSHIQQQQKVKAISKKIRNTFNTLREKKKQWRDNIVQLQLH
jgi:hypothetical protein